MFLLVNKHTLSLPVLLALAILGATAACSSSGDSPQAPATTQAPMAFNAVDASLADSRADSQLAPYNTFAVWATKTASDGTTQEVMAHIDGTPYEVWWNGSAWTYEFNTAEGVAQVLRYWDTSAQGYHFVAYAPARIGSGLASNGRTISCLPTSVAISGINGNLATNQSSAIDWMVSSHDRKAGSPAVNFDTYADPQMRYPLTGNSASFTDVVSPVFHHIMAMVDFRIFNLTTSDVTITDAAFTLSNAIYAKADYDGSSFVNPSGSTKDIISGSLSGGSLTVAPTNRAHAVQLAEIIEIPQSLSGKQLNVTLTRSDGQTLEGTFDIDAEWLPSNRYIYYLSINETPNSNVILLNIDVELFRWRDGNTIIVTDPITNW